MCREDIPGIFCLVINKFPYLRKSDPATTL
jgi:hypothetical protein